MEDKKIRDKFVSEKLFYYMKLEKLYLGLGIVFSTIRTFLEMLGPFIIGYILDNLIVKDISSIDILEIVKYLLLYLAVYILTGIILNLTTLSFQKAANNITLRIQKDVYKKVSAFPISYFDSLNAGSIVSRITNDTNRLKRMFSLVLSDIFTSSMMAVGIFIVLLVNNWVPALLIATLFPLIALIFIDLRKKTSLYTREVRKNVSILNAKINENIQNMEVINSFNKEDYIKEEFDEYNDKIFKTQLKHSKLRSYSGYRAIDSLAYVATILILLYFGLRKIKGLYPVSVGSLYIVLDYSQKIFNNLNRVVTRYTEFEQAYASGRHALEILKLDEEVDSNNELTQNNGSVSFDSVSFAYDKKYVLEDINLDVKSGKTVAFVGQTGSGKSTIINLLLNFYTPQKGRIYLDGTDISKVSKDSLRREMAVVLQDSFIFKGTIKDNICLEEDFSDSQVESSLRDLGADILLKKGIHTELLEKANNLSAGEKQLISFARAYIRNPKILILDEATSNIDTESEILIQKAIEKLKENRTTFMIAHRLSTIKDADEIIVLQNGKIISRGSHEYLLENSSYYHKLYLESTRKNNMEF